MKTFKSDLSQQNFPDDEKISAKSVRKSILKLIEKDYPDFTEDKCLAASELNYYRRKYIADVVARQTGEVTDLEKNVIESLSNNTTLSDKIDLDEDGGVLTFGQRVADKVASFGGSWTFIITFILILVIWIAANALLLSNKGFDPYPFILLNLLLSCLAALQAPVIMMSQNRQGDKDRERAKKDYMVNLKSELEIRNLHEKIDHLIIHQQQELMEVQKIQIEMMNDILEQTELNNRKKKSE
jgi:uncharacterized membrane protein